MIKTTKFFILLWILSLKYSIMINKNLRERKNTSAFETINSYINLNYDRLKENVIHMLNGGRVSVDTESFKNGFSEINSGDDAITALIHLGYLGYDSSSGEAYVPNYEVARAFHSAMKTSEWKEIKQKTISSVCYNHITIRKRGNTE